MSSTDRFREVVPADEGPGLTILAAMRNVHPDLREEDRKRALSQGLVRVADDCAGNRRGSIGRRSTPTTCRSPA